MHNIILLILQFLLLPDFRPLLIRTFPYDPNHKYFQPLFLEIDNVFHAGTY